VKGEEDRRTLWAAIADDRVQVVSSDHSAYPVATRFEEMGSTLESELMQGGQTAVELRVPVLYHLGVAEGRIDVRRFIELISANPAKLMGLYPRKGLLAPGSDADVTVFDPNRPWTVRWQDLHMSPEYSCWDGWELQGRVRSVVLRGNVLVENHTFVGSRTSGEYVPRTLDPRVVSHPRGEPLIVGGQASVRETGTP
jgi:dihydropyrimidinase